MKICTKGVWDETIPGISFDDNGVSNFCYLQEKLMADYPRGEKGQTDWAKLVSDMKAAGKGKRYDCVLGVSGGVDSSYLLHLAHEYGLRPLAVNLDNGFSRDIAVQNIFNVTSALGIDLETYVIDYEEIKDLLRAYMKAGMPWIDSPTDLAIKATMYKVARAEGIPYILRGNDFRSEGKQPKEWTYADSKQLRFIHRQFGTSVSLKTYPLLPLPLLIYSGLIKGIKDIRPYYYLDYTKQEAKRLLMETYGWKDYGGHHHENLFTKFAMAYWLPRKFGIDKRKITLSAQVLSGVMTRQEALTQLKQPFGTEEELEDTRAYVVKKLALSNDEFQRIWSAPTHNTFDYPSDYAFIFKLVRNFRPVLKKLYAFTPMSVSANDMIGAKS
ncbi:N-acetyl sugar amidotransferase [Spirosoma validum]|uniref:N-acetyl sugar amidotransferase n=1 Tax=Spirosoma validum TaxID=2771355 RepID=A0A927AZ78_9BACT|nr:N-acetyl sugar amidotransferase [Spirosoma validum]MBD2752586.1 N-acetyl sugar amidotransferase [Spirosoma validum]